ncbi:MAG: ATP/GTP-binding protein [Actinomycetota bacterium]
MPRRTRKSPKGSSSRLDTSEEIAVMSERLLGPSGARLEGYAVRRSTGKDKSYRCPYCQGTIPAGQSHLVSVPDGRPDERRHYHPGCWNKVVRGVPSRVS